MTQSIQTKPQPDIYLRVEDFVIGSISTDIIGDHALNNEIRMFLLMLVYHHNVQKWESGLK